MIIFFGLLYVYFPKSLPSITKRAIDDFISNPLKFWWFVFPLFGLMVLFFLVILYGINFLASFGRGYRAKEPYYANISILIASKDERVLLERTLESIVQSEYPKEKIQVIVVTSGSTDDSTEFCKNFIKEHTTIDMEVLSEPLPKKGKPPALNYGLKHVKNDIVVLYDSGCVLDPYALKNLISPFKNEKKNAVIGPVLVKNWKTNILTRAIHLDYAIVAGGGILFDIRNRLGKSTFSFGRNLAVRTKFLRNYGGFNENSLTEDLYLSVLLNLDGVKIYFSPKAKVYDHVPSTWNTLDKQRRRWMAGYVGDAPQLMAMEKDGKKGKSIIISRNMSIMFIGNMDTWMYIVIGFAILYFFIGEFYLLSWTLACLFFQFGILFNATRKFADKHYSILPLFFISGYIHLYMFLLNFKMPKEVSWEKTAIILEKQKEEINELAKK